MIFLSLLSTSGVIIVLCISCCQAQDVLKVKSLTSVKFDHPDTPHVEYICMGALQINLVNENELLLGVCTPTIEDLSAAIGTLAISELEKNQTTGANLLYGSLNNLEPKGSDPNWDGTGVNARIKRPEQFYQTKDAIRFIDDRSCAREINRTTEHVRTVLGTCAVNTLNIAGAVLSACYGMTYFEEKEMWVFSVVNDGLYVYKEGGTPRLILKKDHLSSVISTNSRQLQRDLDQYGKRNNIVWNKIRTGINYYDFTNISYESGNITFRENFVRYISATGKSPIDTTARRHNVTDPALGSSDGDMSVAPNGQVLAIADISLDRLFFLDIANADKNNTGQIKPLQAICMKSKVVEDRLDNCTFIVISAAGWINPSTFVTYEQKFGVFRKFTVTPQKPLPEPTPDTTTYAEAPSNAAIKSVASVGSVLAVGSVIAAAILMRYKVKSRRGGNLIETSPTDDYRQSTTSLIEAGAPESSVPVIEESQSIRQSEHGADVAFESHSTDVKDSSTTTKTESNENVTTDSTSHDGTNQDQPSQLDNDSSATNKTNSTTTETKLNKNVTKDSASHEDVNQDQPNQPDNGISATNQPDNNNIATETTDNV